MTRTLADDEFLQRSHKSNSTKPSQTATNFRKKNFNNTSMSPRDLSESFPSAVEPEVQSIAQLTSNALHQLQQERIKKGQQRAHSDILSSDKQFDAKSAVNSLVIKKRLNDFQKKAFGLKNVEMVGEKLYTETGMNKA